MKQLTIFLSPDLEHRAIDALERAGVEGFLRLEGATGNKFLANDPLTRIMTWEAVALLVPGADDGQAASVVEELGHYADACETRPCLRIVVSPVEAVV